MLGLPRCTAGARPRIRNDAVFVRVLWRATNSGRDSFYIGGGGWLRFLGSLGSGASWSAQLCSGRVVPSSLGSCSDAVYCGESGGDFAPGCVEPKAELTFGKILCVVTARAEMPEASKLTSRWLSVATPPNDIIKKHASQRDASPRRLLNERAGVFADIPSGCCPFF